MDITYELKHPITLRTRVAGAPEKETVIAEVTVRRMKAKDLRLLDRIDGKFSQSLALIGAITGLNSAALDEMDTEDVEGIGTLMGDFFPGRQLTGDIASAT